MNYLAFNHDIVEPDLLNKPKEISIRKVGKVSLNTITDAGIPRSYLYLSAGSTASGLRAGIFLHGADQ